MRSVPNELTVVVDAHVRQLTADDRSQKELRKRTSGGYFERELLKRNAQEELRKRIQKSDTEKSRKRKAALSDEFILISDFSLRRRALFTFG